MKLVLIAIVLFSAVAFASPKNGPTRRPFHNSEYYNDRQPVQNTRVSEDNYVYADNSADNNGIQNSADEASANAPTAPAGGEIVSLNQLKCVFKNCRLSTLQKYLEPMNKAMARASITTKKRIRAFLAQVGHESGEFQWFREFASGKKYEGRKDLGNTQKGDGVKFKGRGPIQITGRVNYTKCGQYLGIDLTSGNNNLKVEQDPTISFGCTAWYWISHHLNDYCDKDDFRTLTRRINGKYRGYADRLRLWNLAKKCIA